MAATAAQRNANGDANLARLSAALAAWSDGGKQDAVAATVALIEASEDGSLSLGQGIYAVLTTLSAPAVVEYVQAVVEAAPPLHPFCVALLDTIEEIKGAEADALAVDKEHDTGLDSKIQEVINSLVSTKAIPPHYVSLLLSPEHFATTPLHPFHTQPPGRPDFLHRGLVKVTTAAFYKQRNSNLLREASEGFSHLIIVLTSPAVFAEKPETDEERLARAKSVWADIENIIGTYNLAPIRVLDLIIEVASCHVAAHWRFFIELIKVSYWGRHRVSPTAVSDGVVQHEAALIAESMEITDKDDTTIAKALGFWFTFYQNADNGNTPVGLVVFAALLIKHGFVKPALLFPNLSPDDEGMAAIEARYKAAMSSRSGPNNALMNTVLVDDDAPATSDKAQEEEPKKQTEQKIDLLHALISIGEVSFALQLLAQYPWVIAAYPNIAQLVLRNVDYCIDPVYRKVTKLPGYTPAPVRHAPQKVPTLSYPVPPSTSAKEFEFFFPGWNEFIEQWDTIEDVYTKGEHWLRLLSGLGGRASGTMTKLCRIMRVYFDALRAEKLQVSGFDPTKLTRPQILQLRATPEEIAPWADIIRGTLLPALSVSDDATACFDEELEQVLAQFPWETLACLFGEWRDNTCNNKSRGHMPPAANASTKATREIKQALSRVTAAQSNPAAPTRASQASERVPARALAKHGRANPAALWTVSNSQVMAYGSVGNIGEHIIEVGRYTNRLSEDVAVFTWVDTLSNANTNHRAIENLATFVGLINRRFVFNLEPLLQLVVSGLKNNNVSTLTVIEKLMSGMIGEDIVGNFAISVEQLNAYTAGTEMFREAFYSTENTRGDRKARRSIELLTQIKKSVPRLTTALRNTGLAVPILIGLARMATSSTLFDINLPVREMSNRRDFAHDVFSQYCAFVAEHLREELHSIPSLRALLDCGIEAQLVWTILRAAHPEAGDPMEAEGMSDSESWWPAGLTRTIDEVQDDDELLDRPGKALLGSAFFVRFNSLQASDICASPEMYDKAIARIQKLIRELSGPGVKTADMRNETARLNNRIKVLEAEKKEHEAHVQRVRDRLKAESARWFNPTVIEKASGGLASQLHDRCFYPRAIDSPEGAVFVAKFIRMAHDFGTPGFSTTLAYNLFLRTTLSDKIFECTEAEARNLGRCLLLMIKDFDRWFLSEEAYYREALGGPVPAKEEKKDDEKKSDEKKDKENTPPAHTLKGLYYRSSPTMPNTAPLWSVFKHIFGKMHTNLCQSLIACWNPANASYSPRNAVVIALQLLPVFPLLSNNAKTIEETVRGLLNRKDGSITPDIVPAFNSYLSQLATRKTERPCVPPARVFPQAAAAAAKLKAEQEAAKAKEEAAKAEAAKEAAKQEAEEKGEKMDETKAVEPAGTPATGAASLPPAPAANDNARALRAKLEQARAASAKLPPNPTTHPLPANPTLPSRPQPHPDRAAGLQMGPPHELSVDKSRAAARARKFGQIEREGLLPQIQTQSQPPSQSQGSQGGRTPRSPPREPRGRSGTEDSRVSDRSRRDGRDARDGRDRDARDSRDRPETPRDDRSRDGRDERNRERNDGRDGRNARDARDDRRDGRDHPRDRERDGRDRRERDDRRDGRDRDGHNRDDRDRGEGRDRERDSRDARPDERDNRRRDDRDRRRDGRDGRSERGDRERESGSGWPRDRENRDAARDAPGRDARDGRDTPRDARSRDSRDTRDSRDSRDSHRDGRERDDRRRRDRDGRDRDGRDRDGRDRDGRGRDTPTSARPDEKERDKEREKEKDREVEKPREEEHKEPKGDAAPRSAEPRDKESRERRDDRPKEDDRRRTRSELPPPATLDRPPHEKERPAEKPAEKSDKAEDESRKRPREEDKPEKEDRRRRGGSDSRGGTPRRGLESLRRSPKRDLAASTDTAPAPSAPASGESSGRRESRRELLQREARNAPSSRRGNSNATPNRELLPSSSAPSGASSLAARMGLQVASPAEDSRKRGHDESAPSYREDSPGVKRRRGRGRERESAGGRLLAGAMRAAAGEK